MHRLLSDRARGWRRALCGIVLGLLAWSAHGVPAKAPQDLRIDGEVLPGRSIDLLEQALSRVKFNTDPQQLRRGLVENRLLARAVEDQLTAQSRADLDASVEIEAGNLLEQVYGRRYREDLGPYLRQPRALSAERLREVLAPRSRGLVENSLLLDETQRREAAGVELIGWQFPGQPAQLLSAGARVQAKAVVLATNAWSAALPRLSRLIVPVNSSIAVTEAIPQRLERIGWTGGEAITDSQLMVDYYRTTRDGRIAFGKGTGAISYGSRIGRVFDVDRESLALTEADFRRTYPSLGDIPLVDGWSGPIDRTYDSLPVFGRLHENIHYGIGWSGNGVGPSRLGGRILASLALGRDDPWSRCPLVERRCRSFPPEPLRYLGGSLVRNAVLRKERAELAGTAPSATDRFLARFAPAGLEDKS